MDEQGIAITVIHGTPTEAQAKLRQDIVGSLNGNRIVFKDTSPLQNGDVLFVDDLSELNLIASNVLLVEDDQAPIFRLASLEEALAGLEPTA